LSTPRIQIAINQPKDLFQMKANAFITILNHAHRFWQKDNPKSEYAYGMLSGYIEGTTRIVTEAIPLLHAPSSDIVFDESFFKHWDDLNLLKQELESIESCIGWYKIITGDFKFKAPDIRNQVKIQSLNPKYIALLLDPSKLLDEDEYGFSIFKLNGDRIFHEMCDYVKIPWEIMEIGQDVDKVVNSVIDMIRLYHSDKPFVEELEEVKVPIPPPSEDGKDEDDGEYVTPKMDPNAPFFF
jgi:hypothetical protein